jgi:hypothetical protein
MSYAKAEILWYFRHAGEALPAGPARGGALGGPAPTVVVKSDGRVVQLLAAAARLHMLLVGLAGGGVVGGSCFPLTACIQTPNSSDTHYSTTPTTVTTATPNRHQVRYASATRAFMQQRVRAMLLQQLDAGTAAISAAAAAGLEAAQRGVREAPRPGDAGAAAALAVANQMADIAATLQVGGRGRSLIYMHLACWRCNRTRFNTRLNPAAQNPIPTHKQAICSRAAAISGAAPNGSFPTSETSKSTVNPLECTLRDFCPDAKNSADPEGSAGDLGAGGGAPDAGAQQPSRESSKISAPSRESSKMSQSRGPAAAAAASKEPSRAASSGGMEADVSRSDIGAADESSALVYATNDGEGEAEEGEAEEGEAEAGAGAEGALLQQWLSVCVQLCSTHSALRSAQLELPAKDPRYVETVNEVGFFAC